MGQDSILTSEQDSSECQVENRPPWGDGESKAAGFRLWLSSRRERTLLLEILPPWPGEDSQRLTTFQVGRGQSWDPGVEVTGPPIRTTQEEKRAAAESGVVPTVQDVQTDLVAAWLGCLTRN